MMRKTREQIAKTGHMFDHWLEVEMRDSKAKERAAWQAEANEWESQGKPITIKEVTKLLGGSLRIDELREIKAGTSPILDGFRLVNEDGSPFIAPSKGEGQ